MSNLWIKICGINQAGEAETVAQLGADALGVILHAASPRAVTVEECDLLLSGIGQGITRFAVLVDPTQLQVSQVLATGVIDSLQFHGEESAAFCEQFGVPYSKAIRVKNYDQALRLVESHPEASLFLLDTYKQGVAGGTGKQFDWSLAARLVESIEKPVILAGGLNPENLPLAIEKVNPWGVDVVSGVERSPAVKDMKKVKQFIEAGRHVRR